MEEIVNKIKLENIGKCPVCKGETTLLYSDLEDRLFGVKGKFTIRKCLNPDCTVWHLNPMPLDDEIWKCYQTYYTHEQKKYKIIKPFSLMTRAICKWTMSIIERCLGLKKELQFFRYMGLRESKPGKLLEIGCGNGKKLLMFQNLGWDVEGIEPDKAAAEKAKNKTGAIVYTDSIEKLNLETDKYDAIIMHHVVEHFKYPNRIFDECFRVLKKKGVLVLGTPNCCGYGSKHFGFNWFALEPPRHLVLFNHQSLNKLASITGFGNITIKPKISGQRWSFETSEEILSKGNCLHLYDGGISSPKSIIKSVYHQIKHYKTTKSDPTMGNEIYMWCTK